MYGTADDTTGFLLTINHIEVIMNRTKHNSLHLKKNSNVENVINRVKMKYSGRLCFTDPIFQMPYC